MACRFLISSDFPGLDLVISLKAIRHFSEILRYTNPSCIIDFESYGPPFTSAPRCAGR